MAASLRVATFYDLPGIVMSCNHFLQGSDVVPCLYDSGPGTGWAGWVLTNRKSYFTTDALNDTVIVPEIRERFGVRIRNVYSDNR